MNNEIKVTQLPSAEQITQNDLLMIVQNDENKKATSSQFLDMLEDDLENYVQFTDYATINDAGVIKANSMSGFKVGNVGNPYADTKTYNQYSSLQDSFFIGKGTLENVIAGKELTKDHLTNVSSQVDTDYKTNVLTTTNLFTGPLYNGIIGQNGVYEYGPARITMANKSLFNTLFIKKGTYTLSIDGLDFCTALTKDTNGNRIDNFADSWKPLPFTFTITQDAYLYFSARKSDSSNINPNDYEPVLVEGETAPSTYIPFINNTINVNNEKYTDTINVGTDINNKNRINVLYSKNIWIPTLTNGGTNISPTNCTATLNNDEYTFTATGSDMQFGQIAPENNNYTNSLGTLYEVKNASSIGILLTNTNFTRNYITFYNSNKVSLGYTRIDSNTGSVSVPSGATYFSWRIGLLNATSGTQYKTKIIVLYNTTPTTYEPYIVPSINVDGDEIYSANVMNYDTTERVIGTYNGKPLYRKMFVYTNLTANTNNNFDWNSTNIIVNIYGIVIGDSGFRASLNSIFGSDLARDRATCYYAASTNKLRSYCGSNLTGNNIYNTNIVVEYTKTTD